MTIISQRWLSEALAVITIFSAINLTFTLLSLAVSSPETRIGALRPIGTIPLKMGILAITGLALGLLASLAYRRLDFHLVALAVSLTILLDLDHLPSLLGIAQPARPAHSFAFIALLIGGLRFVYRKPPQMILIILSSFIGHLAVDGGIFPLLAPLSFTYMRLGQFSVPLILTSIATASLSGYLKRRQSHMSIG